MLCFHTVIHREILSATLIIPTLATGALAAVYDRQDDRLALSTVTLQAEETHWVVRVQAVTTALAN